MNTFVRHFVSAVVAAAMAACGGVKPAKPSDGGNAGKKDEYAQFAPAMPPAAVLPEQQPEWMREHFWDGFMFADSAYVAAQDSTAIIRMYMLYALQFAGAGSPEENRDDVAARSMTGLMERAGASPHAYRYFASLAETVLFDPNSPMRNDELYIPVLEHIIASPLSDDSEKTVAQYKLQVVSQNRPGRAANDFAFVDMNGRSSTLYKTRAEWLLLFFSNPGCPLCAEITQQLQESEIIAHAIDGGVLKIIALYPDDDVDAWRRHAGDIPSRWIYARDASHEIRDRRLYDLKAIPALYLLDAQKRVAVKDASEISIIEMTLYEALRNRKNL